MQSMENVRKTGGLFKISAVSSNFQEFHLIRVKQVLKSLKIEFYSRKNLS